MGRQGRARATVITRAGFAVVVRVTIGIAVTDATAIGAKIGVDDQVWFSKIVRIG